MAEFPSSAIQAIERSLLRADRTDRVRIRVTGPDRAAFLQNLTTNEMKRVEIGSGREAFVTSPQGKTMALVTTLTTDDAILIHTESPALETLLPHLRKYGALEEIELVEITEMTYETHLVGARLEQFCQSIGVEPLPSTPLDHQLVEIAGKPVRIVREDPFGVHGLTLLMERNDAEAVLMVLDAEGKSFDLEVASSRAVEALRIDAGTPVSGQDLSEKNLPQELERDKRAISFVKGCYLGQETVARLDALGHVNRVFRGFSLEAPNLPEVGETLQNAEGSKEVGWLTSIAISERTGNPIALGYVRVAQSNPEQLLALKSGGQATVRRFPISGDWTKAS